MKLSLFAALAVVGITTSAAAQNADLAAVSAHLKQVATMTANFAQTDRVGKTLNGVLSLKRPGRVRFQYQKGVPILLVSDGKALTFIDYSVRQVQRWPIGNSPLAVLLNPDRDITRFARTIPAKNADTVLVEARDAKRPEFGVITMAFVRQASAPGGLMLQGWVALDNQNNRTVVRLSGQQFNVPISDDTFKWRDPRPVAPKR